MDIQVGDKVRVSYMFYNVQRIAGGVVKEDIGDNKYLVTLDYGAEAEVPISNIVSRETRPSEIKQPVDVRKDPEEEMNTGIQGIRLKRRKHEKDKSYNKLQQNHSI